MADSAVGPGRSQEPVELRLLGGPNAYFGRPAVHLVVDVANLLSADAGPLSGWGQRVSPVLAQPGPAGSTARRRYLARLATSLTRAVAAAAGAPRLPVLGHPGPGPARVTIAYPWRYAARAEALGRAVAAALARLPGDDLGHVLTDAARSVRDTVPGPLLAIPRPRSGSPATSPPPGPRPAAEARVGPRPPSRTAPGRPSRPG